MAEGDPWCETGPVNQTLYAIYWIMHLCWLCNIILTCYGSYRIFTNNEMKRKIFKMLYLIIGICFIIAPPGFSFGFQAGWECWYDDFYLWEGTTIYISIHSVYAL